MDKPDKANFKGKALKENNEIQGTKLEIQNIKREYQRNKGTRRIQ